MSEKKSICLVTAGQPSTNPRLVKEANTLSAKGYQVHVIFCECRLEFSENDDEILKSSVWSWDKLSLYKKGKIRFFPRLTLLLARKAFLLSMKLGKESSSLACLASHPLYLELLRNVRSHRADLYIGHCLPALPIVCAVAKRYGAVASFDAEDYHCAENSHSGGGIVLNQTARLIEDHYFPELHGITAASPLIAAEYGTRFQTAPTPLLNVFTLPEEEVSPKSPSPTEVAPPAVLSVYWFSQTVGAHRGLEEMVEILKHLNLAVILVLRGVCSDSYKAILASLCAGSEVELRVEPPAHPDQMVPLSQQHSMGLAIECSEPLNRDLCLTNKAFTYLLAGIPVILSDTSAQAALAQELGDAAVLISLSNPAESAERLRAWFKEPETLQRATNAAARLGRERYNWGVEKETLLEHVRTLLKD